MNELMVSAGLVDSLKAFLAGIMDPEKIKKIVGEWVRKLVGDLIATLKAQAALTTTPLDDMAVKALEDALNSFLNPVQDGSPIVIVGASAEDEEEDREWFGASPESRQGRLAARREKRLQLVRDLGGEPVGMSPMLISILVNVGIAFAKWLIERWMAKGTIARAAG